MLRGWVVRPAMLAVAGVLACAFPAGALAADDIAPAINVAVPADGQQFVHHAQVASSFSCDDGVGGSGVKTCDGPATIDTATVGQHVFTVTATDNANNVSQHSVAYTVADDTTAPAIAIFTPAEGQHLSQNSTVSGVFICGDGSGGSGIASCSGPATVDTSTLGAHTYTVTATDNAGNHASKTVNYVVDLADTAQPTIGIVTPAIGQHFAHNDSVASVFACTDDHGVSGIATCDGAPFLDTSTVGEHSFTVTSTDHAGNSATATVNYIVDPDDVIFPGVAVTTPVEGAHYAQGASVPSAFACADNPGGSGLASCSAPARVDTTTAGPHTFTLVAIDHAGNASTQVVNYVVDAAPVPPDTTAPAIGISVPASAGHYLLGASVNSSFSCSDSGSGIATCAGPAKLDTSTIGTHTFTVTATDKAGNPAAAVVSYVVDSVAIVPIIPSTTTNTGSTKGEQIVSALGKLYGSSSQTLRSSARSLSFKAPAAGVLTIRWTSGKSVVARGSHIFAQAGTSKVTVKLTAAGKRLLKGKKNHKLAVTSTASFAPDTGEAHSASKKLTIKAG